MSWLRSQQTAEQRREPVLPIAETIAARSGGLFPPRSSVCPDCKDTMSTTVVGKGTPCPSDSYVAWGIGGPIDPSFAARMSGKGVHSLAAQLGLRCGRPDYAE
jgi:hypothetical protein